MNAMIHTTLINENGLILTMFYYITFIISIINFKTILIFINTLYNFNTFDNNLNILLVCYL